jgi:hypothetical protein
MDRETMDRVQRELEAEVRERFPAGAVRGAAVLQYGDAPVIEPGELLVRVFLSPEGGPEDHDRLLDAFMYDNKAALAEFRRYIAGHLPEASQLQFTFDESAGPEATRTVMHLRRAIAEERAVGLTPVMARLGPVDLETLDSLIRAGIVASRAEGLRWALARIRERPAYDHLRERAREIERLKTEF